MHLIPIMGKISKTLALMLILVGLTSLVLLPQITVKAQTNSAPSLEWQQEYGSQVHSASNLIQTVDGGYVFMDLGYGVTGWFKPSILIKVDSDGTLQWNKTIADYFTGSQVIQTIDKGFEISGWWNAYRFGGGYHTTPTIINTDPDGNIQQVRNYTTLPNLGINYSNQIYAFESPNNGSIQTSDGGFAYWNKGIITKTDSGNNTQWVKTLTYPTIDAYPSYTYPLTLTSVIETSDGSLSALGVGYRALDNHYSGKIYLVKTVSFLPLPLPTQLPTSLPSTTPSNTIVSWITPMTIPVIAIIILAIIFISLLLYRRYRKTANLGN
jgi:hypothetical protein